MDLEHHSRQSFLGEPIIQACERANIGIVGLGGGGSQVAQQLAHIGFRQFALFDPDSAERSNLSRLVGATLQDVALHKPKVAIARRMIRHINTQTTIRSWKGRWQDNVEDLEECDIVFGCVDGFGERDQLERFTRRNLIPYIDIGMDVFRFDSEHPRMAGQVFISMPGHPCMRCMGFFTDEDLHREGELYGDAGPNPQVIWANGVLASTAVGLAVGILTGWHGKNEELQWLSYDGNLGTLTHHIRSQFHNTEECPHYPLDKVGPARFQAL